MSAISPGRNRTWRALAIIMALAGCIGMAVVTAVSVTHPNTIRALAACLVAAILLLLSARSPRACVIALMVFLAVLGLVRRILVPYAGWSSYDPLVLVGPVVTLVLVAHRQERRELASNRLPTLIAVLLGLAMLEVFNPNGGGLIAGATGLLFLAVPLLWFFIGRRLADDRLVVAVLCVVLVGGCLSAAYGLWQSRVGLPPWDAVWVNLAGYSSLVVGGVTRAFSFFSSWTEYAMFLATAFVVVLARTLLARLWTVALIPLLAWALLVESARAVVVQLLAALLLMTALRTGTTRRVLAIVVTGVVVLAIVDHFLAARLGAMASTSTDPLLAHQLGGLADPMNQDKSTLQVHAQLVASGFLAALHHPLGMGTASTNLAGVKFSQSAVASEIDVSDTFISFGLLGGPLYMAIVVMVVAQACSVALRRRDVASLAAVGILLVTFGHWLHGAYYVVSPLVWLLIGWISQNWRAGPAAASPPARA